MKYIFTISIALFSLIFTTSAEDDGGKKRKKSDDKVVTPVVPTPPAAKKDEPQFKLIEDVVKKCTKTEGLFNIYQDTTVGKTYLEIPENLIGKEIIYFKHVLDGVMEAGYFKGAYRDVKIFKVEKYYDRIDLVEQNTSYYFDPENALAKSATANINYPVVFSQTIAGMSTDTGEVKTKRYLIEADNLFLGEAIAQITPSIYPGAAAKFSVGKINKSKCKYLSVKSYPENTDVVVEYAFENLYPTVGGSAAVTNSRYVSVVIQHSFLAMPENNYKPRLDDSRIGYFNLKITDLTSASETPYRDLIKRWYLTKKDSSAAISEPVEPITWWIENTTPVEIRASIKEAALKWNEAFELAGFKNALVIKEQPDTADWDAGDIRYNVLRWTASPNPPFGGYGPSFANPRTGQILGADIMLEYVYLTNRMQFQKIFDIAGMPSYETFENTMNEDVHFCAAGLHAAYEGMFAAYAMDAMEMSTEQKSVLLEESLHRLILHELGHTLGLMHNFCGSTLYTSKEMNDPEIGGKNPIASSVMDYHAINLNPAGEQKFGFSIDKPGIYDIWAIEYGYTEFANDEEEKKGLAKILAKGSDPRLCFGNDADDMRSTGRGIDPRMMVNDNSADPIEFSINRMEIVKKTMPNLKKNILEEGASYQELRSAYLSLTGSYAGALEVISKQIGGVYINSNRVGEPVQAKPLTPVPYKEQKRAMAALAKYAFSPDAFQFDNEILNYLKIQRRGFDMYSTKEDPQMHSRVLNSQKSLLNQLLHPNVLARLSDSELYGNEYSVNEVLSDITNAIFKEDIKTNVNGYRQNVQTELVVQLGEILKDTTLYDYRSKAAAYNELMKIKGMIASSQSPNESTKAHRKYITYTIDQMLDAK
jgi:hypothetical protein